MGSFDGRVALVTGASTGIGRATALAFAREGAAVVVADVNAAKAEETVRLCSEVGRATFVRCDVSRGDEVKACVQAAVSTYGRLDIGFNNAGVEGRMAPTAEYPEDVFRRVIDVNLTGAWLCMREEIPAMRKAGGGSIVNCASILGRVGFASASAYTAAKHGLIGLTEAAALEYATAGIRVNAVCPGFIVTPMLERSGITSNPQMKAGIEALHPMKRMGTPEEIASAVLWLCSPGASFVTGTSLYVDGGYTAQ